ncbi:MAG: YHYH protein [Phormidesmis sp.]
MKRTHRGICSIFVLILLGLASSCTQSAGDSTGEDSTESAVNAAGETVNLSDCPPASAPRRPQQCEGIDGTAPPRDGPGGGGPDSGGSDGAPPDGDGPSGDGPGGDGPGANRQSEGLGEPVPETEVETSGVLCDASIDVLNEQLDLQSEATWSCADGKRQLIANGVPDHQTGFSASEGRGDILTHEVNVTFPLTPVARTGSGTPVINIAYALNGVKFNPGTGGRCESDITELSDCDLRPNSSGQWNMEALGQSSFDFGEDANHAHLQRGGVYHYHGLPEGMRSQQNLAGESMQLIGWAVDGFPLYAQIGYSDPDSDTGALRAMEPSYRLKATPDSGRPSTDIVPMGGFTQDYEYVEGLGDLDECNGRFGVTPEFPQGVYHYYATDAYPFVQRCVKGTPDSSERRPSPPPDGEGPSPESGLD